MEKGKQTPPVNSEDAAAKLSRAERRKAIAEDRKLLLIGEEEAKINLKRILDVPFNAPEENL
ncbi:MAG TPA: hypothetical protein VFE53_11890 [Mucilaginibacter sp.]|jgi:hypothetical protein|nr:hypothetical protein [Mucilaginibacter sp.]